MNGIARSFDTRQVVAGITAGLVVGLIVVVVSISLATLIFSGGLSQYVSRGIGLFLFGGLTLSLVICLFGSLPGTAISPQDGPAALIAVGAVGIAGMLAGYSTPDSIYSTVVAGIILSSLVTGLTFFLIGQFKLGNLVRYIPYPVVGGFLAGTGWLLTRGAIEVMAGQTLSLQALRSLIQSDMLLRWLPGTVFAVLVLIVPGSQRRSISDCIRLRRRSLPCWF